jgi:RHS repeat-associated protein
MSLAYDPLGRLAQTTAGATVTRFLYEGDDLAAEYDGSGALLRRYVHGAGVDEPLVWYEGALGTTDKRWLHADLLGSVIFTTAVNGARNYGPYKYGPYGEPAAWSGSRFAYTGQIMLPEARLYHYKARAYDPMTGRFMQTDPVGYDSDLNLYAYVRENPVNAIDPSGEDATDLPGFTVWGTRGGCPDFAECYSGDEFAGGAAAGALTPSEQLLEFLRDLTKVNPVLGVLGTASVTLCGDTPTSCGGTIVTNAPNDAKNPTGAKAPGKPGGKEGFRDPPSGERWVKNPNGRGYGWQGDDGKVWVPTGPGGAAHGGPHWDVQDSKTGGHVNVYPGGRTR